MDDTDRLFREYHAPLVRYLTRRLGDRDWAEEVAQETFLRALRAYDRLEHGESVPTIGPGANPLLRAAEEIRRTLRA